MLAGSLADNPPLALSEEKGHPRCGKKGAIHGLLVNDVIQRGVQPSKLTPVMSCFSVGQIIFTNFGSFSNKASSNQDKCVRTNTFYVNLCVDIGSLI